MGAEQKQIDKAFYSDGYKLGMEAVDAGLTTDALFASQEKLYAAVDNLIEMLGEVAQKQGQAIDCKKGCDWCCRQPIYALSYEMQYLNEFVKTNFGAKEQEKIKRRAEQKNNRLKYLKGNELLNAKFPCPLLQNGACIAYEARPMACRIYLSTNVKSCVLFFEEPQDEQSVPQLLEFPLRAGRMMNEGFKAALKTGGLSNQEFRIEEILLVPPVKIS